MKRILLGALAVVVLFVVALGGFAWWTISRLDVATVTDGVFVLEGMGGNVGVLATSEGAVVVDTMTFVRQGEAIEERVRELTDQPIRAIVNTHYHLDHTHGNPAFVPGTKVVATRRTLEHLKALDGEFWAESPAKELLPNETFDSEHELRLGDDTIRSLHLGLGHTDGDLVVLFVERGVIHMGDLHFNGHYPNIDLEAGASIPGWVETLDRVLELEFEHVIPGHGPVTDRAGIRRYQDFLRSLWDQTSKVVAEGGTLEQALETVDLDEFGLEPIFFAPFLNREFVIGRAFEEASRGR